MESMDGRLMDFEVNQFRTFDEVSHHFQWQHKQFHCIICPLPFSHKEKPSCLRHANSHQHQNAAHASASNIINDLLSPNVRPTFDPIYRPNRLFPLPRPIIDTEPSTFLSDDNDQNPTL